ncbi:MAG: chaperone protein HscB [Chitinophagaceae bacterium]|nr:chaperone protein HscB [Chitinophagaceae bacterium]
MNYFELYNIPVSFQPDPQLVKSRFYELSRKYHPDFFSNADEAEQAEVLEKSSAVNKAYKTFTNPDETIKYVLQQKGLLEEEEKYQLPPDFLMEMMDLNEAAGEGQSADGSVRSAVAKIQEEIYSPVKAVLEGYTEGVTTRDELLQVKEYYFKKKYLNRIMAGLP